MTSQNIPIPHPSNVSTDRTSDAPAFSATTYDSDDGAAQLSHVTTHALPAAAGPATTITNPPTWRFAWRSEREGRETLPRYRLPAGVILATIATSLRGEKRNLREDTQRLVASMPVQPIIHGTENLPLSPPFVILPNHYERPNGAWVGWGAIVISNTIGGTLRSNCPIRWVMTSTWQDCYLGPRRVNPKYLHWVLQRLSNLYGIILMPADDTNAFGRGAALRDLFGALRDPAGQVVAFHPEAGGFETMIKPPKGMGRVLSAIDRQDIPMIPAGVYEEDGRIQVRFGRAIEPGTLMKLSDADASDRVMRRIAELVPDRVRGEYATESDSLNRDDRPAAAVNSKE